MFKVDCKPCVGLIKAGPSVAGQGKRRLARVYRLIFTSLDEHDAENVVWMPAHTSEDEVGKGRLGDGSFLTATDRFGNAEADKLAKIGVEAHRVPMQIRDEVQRHIDLQYELAKWLGQVTVVVGKWLGDGPARDTAASRRKANAEAKAKGERGMMGRRARRVVHLRPIDLGGHRLGKEGQKWQCKVCKMSSRHWARIAGGQCKGSVAKKWAARSRELAAAGTVLRGGHEFLMSGNVVWCSTCGAFTDDGSVKALAKPCGGPHRAADRRWDKSRNYSRRRLVQQLHWLREGVHPTSRKMLPPPTRIDPMEELPAGMAGQYRASDAGRVYAATEQDLNPRMKLMLERVRKRAAERAEATRPVRRRIVVKSEPDDCSGYESFGQG